MDLYMAWEWVDWTNLPKEGDKSHKPVGFIKCGEFLD
jgi:hypothetical protein